MFGFVAATCRLLRQDRLLHGAVRRWPQCGTVDCIPGFHELPFFSSICGSVACLQLGGCSRAAKRNMFYNDLVAIFMTNEVICKLGLRVSVFYRFLIKSHASLPPDPPKRAPNKRALLLRAIVRTNGRMP